MPGRAGVIGLKISFNISRPDISYPIRRFKIYNLAERNSGSGKTSSRRIKFVAGYQDNYGLIFSEQISIPAGVKARPTHLRGDPGGRR